MSALRVLEAGLRSTVQDRGRWGHLRAGIPPAGPADPTAFAAAQRLAGNSAADAAIEIVGLPFRFVLDTPRLVAVTGRDVSLRARGTVAGWTAVFARGGEEVVVLGSRRTRFAYLAVSGGLALEPVLGSRATYLPAAIGPLARPLAPGDVLPLGGARAGAESAGRALAPPAADGRVLALPGPHADPSARGAFFGRPFRVGEASDRVGVRLDGPPLEWRGREILSIGVAPGAVQVPHGGQPIVLLADAQTTGGYPVIASVIGPSLWAVAQAAPGEDLSFYEVGPAAALEAAQAERRWLDALAS